MRIVYTPEGTTAYSCVLTSASGSLTVRGWCDTADVEIEGAAALRGNLTLVMSLSAFAHNEERHRRLRAPEKRESHRKEAERQHERALRMAELVERVGEGRREGWCSSCYSHCKHVSVVGRGTSARTFLCNRCGAPTTPCAVPRCRHLAARLLGNSSTPRYCAEHRHDIPSFEKLEARLTSLDAYEDWLAFDKRNAARATKVVTVGALSIAVLAPAAFIAAPAIGGAVGSLTGLTGAAASSHGLAMFGGGAIAAGGLGMAGGTTVLTALGGALGGAMGATITSAYVRADPSFRIERLADGDGPPVVFATGFLTQGQHGSGGWEPMIRRRYLRNPLYRVHWGAKELRAITVGLGAHGGKHAVKGAVVQLAGRAGKKAAARLTPLGPLLIGAGLAKNPWTVAVTRAGMTGAILADLLARTDEDAFILMGHSLGARVMVTAAQSLADGHDREPRLEAIHLLGAAVSRAGDWQTLNDSVRTTVWNYWSERDAVLRIAYTAGQAGARAVGQKGFRTKFPNIVDRNVSRRVDSHFAYLDHVILA